MVHKLRLVVGTNLISIQPAYNTLLPNIMQFWRLPRGSSGNTSLVRNFQGVNILNMPIKNRHHIFECREV